MAMDEATRLLLESINNNISNLRQDMNSFRDDTREDIADLRNDINKLDSLLSGIKTNHIDKDTCKENMEKINTNAQNLSYKKLSIIFGGATLIFNGLIELVKYLKG